MISVKGVPIGIHADDFGQTINTTKDILELMKMGHLDGISILPNMSDFDESMKMYDEALTDMPFIPLMSIHMDLVEGKMLSSEGLISWNWKKLFLASFHLPIRVEDGNLNVSPNKSHFSFPSETYLSLKNEIREQIQSGQAAICDIRKKAKELGIADANRNDISLKRIRIDSHQHAHMLPIVWKALMEVVSEENYQIEFVRASYELRSPFLKKSKVRKWRLVNILKNYILSFFAPKVIKYAVRSKSEYRYLWGLIMSGCMDYERIQKIMPLMIEECSKKGVGVDLNFHPGLMLEEEINPEIPQKSIEEFYMSTNRKTEFDTVCQMHKYLENLL